MHMETEFETAMAIVNREVQRFLQRPAGDGPEILIRLIYNAGASAPNLVPKLKETAMVIVNGVTVYQSPGWVEQ